MTLAHVLHALPTGRGRRSLCAGVTFAVVVAGCATDAQRTQGEGAAAGAVAGAVAGRLLGGNSEGTALGAVLGAVAGSVVGAKVAEKKGAYAQREDALKASAGHAQQVAQQLRNANEGLGRDIATLEASVQRLQAERLSAENRRNLAQANRQSLTALVGRVDQQLQQVRREISQQTTVVQAEERRAKETKQPVPEQGIRLVAAGIRDLQGQEHALERARLQLQQLDQRRAY